MGCGVVVCERVSMGVLEWDSGEAERERNEREQNERECGE